MKKIKLMVSLLVAVSSLVLNQMPANAEWKTSSVPYYINGVWHGNTTKAWYAEGNSWAIGWKNIDNHWYYFEPDTGYDVSSWQYINGNWYYFLPQPFIGKASPMVYNDIIKDYKKNVYYYLNPDGVYIDNPPEEIKAYINLLEDDEKMKELGILSRSEGIVPGFLEGSTRYFRDNVTNVELCDADKDGILEMYVYTEYLSNLNTGAKVAVKYVNGNIIVDNGKATVNGNVTSTNNASTATKNIIDESGLKFDANSGKVIGYRGDNTKLDIPSTINGVNVTSIGDSAFALSYKLTSIKIPSSVTSIGKDAFKFCDNAKFYVENEKTKDLLINSGVDESKIIL